MYSLPDDTVYHSQHQHQEQQDPEPPHLQPYRYHHSSSPPTSPTNFRQSTSNHDHDGHNHRQQLHNPDLIGRAVHFSTGQFAGQTIRMQLQEIQKADLGRKYARVDRRPLDPPPVVLLRMFHVHHPGSNREMERELNYDDVQALGLLCTVDLFPVAQEPPSPENLTSDTSYKSPLAPPAQPSISSASPSSSSSSAYSPTQHHQHYSSPSYRFVSDAEIPSTSRSLASKSSASHYSGYILPSHSPSDIVHRFGNYPITESSKQTQALVGATFVQPALVDYKGAKSIVFVFADLAVKIEGTFILRYRVFDIFSRPYNHTNDLAITAECYGDMFRVYSTKEFPGLQASTELTKHLARWGVRLNIRETERRRRKRNERRSVSADEEG